MAQAMSPAALNHSSLVRALADLADVQVPESKQSFAERLGQWLGFAEALSLYSVLNPGGAEAPQRRASAGQATAVRAELARVRDTLIETLREPPAVASQAPGEGTVDFTPDFTPIHRHYLARQRQMSNDIGLLRAKVRTALACQTPALKRLAELDAVMEQALGVRERSLLATLPVFLSRRFEQLCAAQQTPAQAEESGAGDWLAAYCREAQTLLLMELELRLQPVNGLIAALENEVAGKQ